MTKPKVGLTIKSCKGCSRRLGHNNAAGWCNRCLREKIDHVCPACKKPRKIARRHALKKPDLKCKRCSLAEETHTERVSTLVTVNCPQYGHPREILRSTYYDYRRDGVAKCRECASARKGGSHDQPWLARLKTRELKINGCVLVPAKEGKQCSSYEKCCFGMYCDFLGIERRMQDCCYQVTKVGWPGWK